MMEQSYHPENIENKWYQFWQDNHYFAPQNTGEPYCIILPPPNVTGSLHMGHGFQHTLMDCLIRYERMRGKNVLWQVGTDHAGIATQMVVERKLAQENISRHELGREAFIEKIWEWKEHSGNTIAQQMKRLGLSADWSRERFTMDQDISDAVIKVFVSLYEEGLITRGTKLVNWDPKFKTAISDLEVINQEEQGFLWHIRYPVAESQASITIATTRPETMLGDVAIAVNPDDERYRDLIGKRVIVPIAEREIPIIADDYVDQAFGTGALKVTPAHDFNDYELGLRHELPLINIFDEDAKLNQQVPEAYQGLDRFVAREKIINALTESGALLETKPHTLMVPRGDRSGEIIEPYLTPQWYLKMGDLAKVGLEAVSSQAVQFVPDNWKNTYNRWLEDIQDWCISRQLWWGHRIPAWYDENGNIYVGENEETIRHKHQLADDVQLTQDDDVLDTWFSSALWPFTTLGWPAEDNAFQTFYPTSVLITGFDIIFFWVARMIMMGKKFTNQVPFHTVYITGLIRDKFGHKMSKSKGNILDPLDLIDGIGLDELVDKRTKNMMQPELAKTIKQHTIEEFPDGIEAYGTDALRFCYCALASTGRDIRFDINRLAGYKNFCNKIWNATKYVLMHAPQKPLSPIPFESLNLIDQWIMVELNKVIKSTQEHLSNYRFDLVAQTIHEFFWGTYCAWYLELSKPALYQEDLSDSEKDATRYTLLTVLETGLRLAHPIMPFITEELWQEITPHLSEVESSSIMIQPYPTAKEEIGIDVSAVEWLQNVLTAIRNIRGEMNISPNKPIDVYFDGGDVKDQAHFDSVRVYLTNLGKLNFCEFKSTDGTQCATALVGQLQINIPMAGLINKDQEISRLTKSIGKIQKEVTSLSKKISNPGFLNKAPEAVVAGEKQKLLELEQSAKELQSKLETIQAL